MAKARMATDAIKGYLEKAQTARYCYACWTDIMFGGLEAI